MYRFVSIAIIVGLCWGSLPAHGAKVRPKLNAAKKKSPIAATTPMTCPQAGQFAIANNPSFRATRANALVALRRLNASRIFPTNPILETLGKGKSKSDKWGPYQFSVALTWKFPIGGHWTARQRALKMTYERVKSELEVASLGVALKAQKICFSLLLEEQKVKLYKGMLAFYKRVYRLVKKRKTSGAANVLELNLARLELLQSQASLTLATGEVKALQRALVAQLGWRRLGVPPLQHKMRPFLQVKQQVGMLQQRGMRQHVMLRMLGLKIKEAEAMLVWAQRKAIPDIKLKFYYAHEEGQIHILGGGLEIPLPILWRNQISVAEKRTKLLQTKLKINAMRFKLRQHIAEIYTRFRAGERVFQLYETQLIPTLQQQLKLRIRGLKLGAFTILQVISAQQSQNKAMLKRIDSLKQLMNSFISLQQALGGLL